MVNAYRRRLTHLPRNPSMHNSISQISERRQQMLSDTMLVVNAIITLFIGVALVLVVRQLGALQKSVRTANLMAAQSQIRTFDQLVVQDADVRNVINYSHWQAVTNMMLHEMEAKYVLWKEGISDAATWQADQAYIKKYANADFVRTALQESGQAFRPDFLTFLAGKEK